jgi:hypothetical protein
MTALRVQPGEGKKQANAIYLLGILEKPDKFHFVDGSMHSHLIRDV